MLLSSLLSLLHSVIVLIAVSVRPHDRTLPVTEVVDRRGERIGFVGFKSHQRAVRGLDIPKTLRELVLLAEDRRFFEHSGVDVLRLLKATQEAVVSGRVYSGASTITQQWVRLQGHWPRSLWAKPFVMLIAIELERQTDKESILTAYLNHVPLGGTILGMGAAAEYYFARPVTALSPGESAALAVLIRAPSALSRHTNVLKRERDRLLTEWQQDGWELAQQEELVLKKFRPRAIAPGYIAHLASLNQHRGERWQTTLDLQLQKSLEDIAEQELARLSKRGVRHGALMVMDAKNGDVVAYIGSADYFNPDAGQLDGLQIQRQPGSLIKTFTYALGFDDGLTAADIVSDTPQVFRSGRGVYRPRNYDESFSGPRRIREALANSLNLPAVLMADQVGVERLHGTLQNFGIHLPKPADHYGVGLTLGNAEMKASDLIQAFTVYTRQDSWVKARWFAEEKTQTKSAPFKADSAWLVTDILKDRHARMEAFGERTVFDLPFELAAKTGTSTDYRDNFAIGWTSEHVVLAWVGNHDQRPMQRVSGITGAGPLVRATMQTLYKQHTPAPFKYAAAPVVKPICALSGMSAGAHCPKVIDEKFVGIPREHTCDWHVPVCENKVLTRYPVDYASWAYDRGLDEASVRMKLCGDAGVVEIAENRKVTYPLDGAVFALDPDMPLDRQKLPLKTSVTGKDIEWEVNGERFMPTSRDGTFDWQLSRGSHVIRLIQNNAKLDEVEIVVR